MARTAYSGGSQLSSTKMGNMFVFLQEPQSQNFRTIKIGPSPHVIALLPDMCVPAYLVSWYMH